MSELPTGTVTFLFADIEGSTRLWEQHGDVMPRALQRYDVLLRAAFSAHGGVVFKTMGDAFCVAFVTAPGALMATIEAQRVLQAEFWELSNPLRVRIALHTAAAEQRNGDYLGPPLNRVARLLAAGHGGQTLLSGATQELVRDFLPPGVELRDLGERRLKDLPGTEHVFQVVTFDLPSVFPPLRALDARRNNLPGQPTPLIGREREVAELTAMLRREDVRLVTLTGPGGTGKTRLSLQVAAGLLDDFPDGIFFVDLAPILNPEQMPSAIVRTLDVKELGDQPALQSLKIALRERQILLVLDNFEQIIAATPRVAELLATAPRLKVVEPRSAPGLRRARVPGAPAGSSESKASPAAGDTEPVCFRGALHPACSGCTAGFRGDKRERTRCCRDLCAAGRPAVGNRACSRAREATRPGGAAPTAAQPLDAAHRRRARPDGAPADAAGCDRLEL
ncbi:MAG TPA: adenylate/guanylate cyclase domain-containing protein [Herpetosiphonaceae bacterium]|nr:adenylate/guanylate cyclase domain-containing protein [Herpetosiphonaceae bacterium]